MSGGTKGRKSPAGTGRGEGWVAAQVGLIGLLLVGPRLGPRWPKALALPARAAGLPLLLAGGYLLYRSVRDLGPSLTPLPRPREDGALVREGLYSRVRHPMYGGGVLAAAGLALVTASLSRLLVTGALLAFFDAKAAREEAWLAERYPEYEAYRAAVPKWWPRWQ